MHGDEHSWIYRGAVAFDLYFVKRDFKNPLWQGYFGYDQPKLGEYLYGGFGRLIYGKDILGILEKVDFNQGLEVKDLRKFWRNDLWWNKFGGDNQLKHIPDKWLEAYMITVKHRHLGVLFGLGVFIWMFLMGKMVGGYWVGLASMTLMAQCPIVLQEFRRATADNILLFFMMGAVYWSMMLKCRKPKSGKSRLVILILCGLFIGGAASVKINGFMILILICLWWIIEFFYGIFKENTKQLREKTKFLVGLVAIIILTLLIFYILNPFVWPDPVSKLLDMVIWRQKQSHSFLMRFPEGAYDNFTERIKGIFGEVLIPYGKYNL